MASTARLAPDAGVPSIADVFRTRGFPALFTAGSLSTWGDNIAIVTIAGVVYERTGSALASAATFAAATLPKLLGQGLLSAIADRVPYRDVLLGSHGIRAVIGAGLAAAVAWHAPIWTLFALLFLIELAAGPAAAAGQMLTTDWFSHSRLYARAFALNSLAYQVNQVIGFMLGATIVGILGPVSALAVNAATFVLAFAVYLIVVPRRRLGGVEDAEPAASYFSQVRAGWRAMTSNRLLLGLLGFSLAAVPAIAAPEAVAIPYAAARTTNGLWRGLLLAAPVAGATLGLVLMGRLNTERQGRLMVPMALITPIVLLPTMFGPPLVVTWALWFLSGIAQTFMLPLQATFSLLVPPQLRGRVFGLAGAIAVASSGLGYLMAGWLSQHSTPEASVTVCAVISIGAAVLMRAYWPRGQFQTAVHQTFAPAAESTDS